MPNTSWKTLRSRLESCIRLPSGLQTERIRWLYEGKVCSKKEGSTTPYLLYWMQTSVRTKFNYSLEYAIAAATALHAPLQVVYVLRDQSAVPKSQSLRDPNAYGYATERHAKFGLEGLANVRQRLEDRGLSFKVFYHVSGKNEDDEVDSTDTLLELARHALLVVTDRPYLRPSAKNTLHSAKVAEDKGLEWGLVQIEGDVVVPCESTSKKEEFAARTIRPKITRELPKFLVELEHFEEIAEDVQSLKLNLLSHFSFRSLEEYKQKHTKADSLDTLDVIEVDVAQIDRTLALLDVDRSVSAISTFIGGEAQANELAKTFFAKKLAKYAEDRNEPCNEGSSNLSLYLHFGHISPVRIALAVERLKGANIKAGRDAFKEEMIVRRELSVNFIVFNSQSYDSMDCLPDFAKKTLQDHINDKRPHLYSLKDLELAKTYDRYWNAAQTEMVYTGKMHGYMRMYWAKKILEWSKTPAEAYEHALHLNNKYCLDAPDPNSYTGIAWSFGKHDQGWKERPIFGKVRYMNETGLKRKFRMDAYIQKVNTLKRTAKDKNQESNTRPTKMFKQK